MSDIQRWGVFVSHDDNGEYVEHCREVDGQYVTYADHVAAVAAAERKANEELSNESVAQFWRGVNAAREAVEPILSDPHGRIYKDTALAAIDGIKP